MGDHAPICLDIDFPQFNKCIDKDAPSLRTIPQPFVWELDTDVKFTEHLKSPKFAHSMQTLQSKTTNPEELLIHFNNMLRDEAISAGLKFKKVFTSSKTNQVWFDDQCIEAKDVMVKLAADIKSGEKTKCCLKKTSAL